MEGKSLAIRPAKPASPVDLRKNRFPLEPSELRPLRNLLTVARELEKQVTQALFGALPDADVAALLAWRNDPHAAAEREALLGAYRAEVKASGAVAIRTMVRGWPRS